MANLTQRKWYDTVLHYADAISAIANAGLVLVSIAGLILVVNELVEIRRQNNVLEMTTRQTYRPIGVAYSDPDNPKMGVIALSGKMDNIDRFTIEREYYIANYGQGLLSYIGQINYISKNEIDFRNALLKATIDSVHADRFYSEARRVPIFPEFRKNITDVTTKIKWENLRFENKYFIYVLFFYEDQDGNLYDTEHLESIPFTPAKVVDGVVKVDIDTTRGVIIRETYHYYSIEDKDALITAIRNLDEPKNHPLADILSLSN